MPFKSAKQSGLRGLVGKKRSASGITDIVKTIATGGSITTSGAYTVHTFTGLGTFTVLSAPSSGAVIEYLIIGGGGGGGNIGAGSFQGGGGGGGGGYRSSVPTETFGGGIPGASEQKFIAYAGQSYVVTVGAGGAEGSQGGDSSVGNPTYGFIVSKGGGRGGTNYAPTGGSSPGVTLTNAQVFGSPAPTAYWGVANANSFGGFGGSGGSAGMAQQGSVAPFGGLSAAASGGRAVETVPSFITAQGYPGGDTRDSQSGGVAAGGGGAGGIGTSTYPTWAPNGAPGGAGISSSINGTATTRAGGGGGGHCRTGLPISSGGSGGSGSGAFNPYGPFPQPAPVDAVAGTANTGSGGGGSAGAEPGPGRVQKPGAAGGSGIVILRYLT